MAAVSAALTVGYTALIVPALMTGAVTSLPVRVTEQVVLLPAASEAVMVTTWVWLWLEVSTAPAAGDWVTVTVQLSLAVVWATRFGTTSAQVALRFTSWPAAQALMTGAVT